MQTYSIRDCTRDLNENTKILLSIEDYSKSKIKTEIESKLPTRLSCTFKRSQKGFYSIFEKVEGKVIERIFAVKKEENKNTGVRTTKIEECGRRIEGEKGGLERNVYNTRMGGYNYLWNNKSVGYYFLERSKEWEQVDIFTFNTAFYTGLNKITDVDDRLKYFNLNYLSANEQFNVLNSFLKYNIATEMSCKLNLPLTNQIFLKELQENKAFRKYVYKLSKEMAGCVKPDYMLYCYKHNKDYADYRDNREFRRNMYYYINYQRYTNPAYIKLFNGANERIKLMGYISKLMKTNPDYKERQVYEIMPIHMDYINACIKLKCDMTLDRTKYPHDLKYWHDFYINQVKIEDEKADREATKKIKSLNSIFNNQIEEYYFILANSQQELIDEGKTLNHCVGRMGYWDKMKEGKSYIVFIRKEKDKPYITCEINPDGKILQIYREKDNSVTEEYLPERVKDKYLQCLKKRLKKLKKENEK